MNIDDLDRKVRALGVRGWDLYAGAKGVETAAAELSEGLVQAMRKADVFQAWRHMDQFLSEHSGKGAMDSEPRAVVERVFGQVDWSAPRLQRVSTCYVVVTGEPSHGDDDGLPGVYGFTLQPHEIALDIGAGSADLQSSAVAKAVLDSFHEHQGIKVLDDFAIAVVLPDGRTLAEEQPDCPEKTVTADYCGVCDLGNLSLPVRNFYRSAQAYRAANHFQSEGPRG